MKVIVDNGGDAAALQIRKLSIVSKDKKIAHVEEVLVVLKMGLL